MSCTALAAPTETCVASQSAMFSFLKRSNVLMLAFSSLATSSAAVLFSKPFEINTSLTNFAISDDAAVVMNLAEACREELTASNRSMVDSCERITVMNEQTPPTTTRTRSWRILVCSSHQVYTSFIAYTAQHFIIGIYEELQSTLLFHITVNRFTIILHNTYQTDVYNMMIEYIFVDLYYS